MPSLPPPRDESGALRLQVDSGAYRYSSRGETPLLTALIEAGLNMPHAAYDGTHDKIITDPADPDSNAGYVRRTAALLAAKCLWI